MKFQSNMMLTGLATAAGIPAALASPSFLAERSDGATDASLYAYGTLISGLPIQYSSSNGRLYVAQSETTASDIHVVPVTWTIPALSSASTTSTSAKLSNGTSPGVLSAGVTDEAMSDVSVDQIGNGTTTGYTLYGKQLIYYDGTSLQSKFWAKQVVTGNDSVWQLLWNNKNEDDSELTPVAIKITAPVS